MREKIARKLMNRYHRHTPALLRRLQIQVLTNLAADTFGVRRKRVWTRSARKALREYARFTVRCMDVRRMDENPVSEGRLFRKAYALGSRVRRLSGLKKDEDLQRLVFLLYRNIDITMEGSLPGNVTVPHCYFSRHYTPEQCRLMSCVDSGIIAGIFGGGGLEFSHRITEGKRCCKACFERGRERK